MGQRRHRPTATERRHALAELERRCRTADLPCTPQRRAVFAAVLDLDSHPTADEVVDRIKARGGKLGRVTVYRTLEHLTRLGLITKACHTGRGLRFDPTTSQHHHLVCLRCDEITDLHDARLDRIRVPDTSRLGFEIAELRVQVRGLCQRCRKEEAR